MSLPLSFGLDLFGFIKITSKNEIANIIRPQKTVSLFERFLIIPFTERPSGESMVTNVEAIRKERTAARIVKKRYFIMLSLIVFLSAIVTSIF